MKLGQAKTITAEALGVDALLDHELIATPLAQEGRIQIFRDADHFDKEFKFNADNKQTPFIILHASHYVAGVFLKDPSSDPVSYDLILHDLWRS